MAVLIKGMDIPVGCFVCEFNVGGKCVVMGRPLTTDEYGFYEIYDLYDKVSDNCPLVEIPKGARLIDARELNNKVLKWLPPDPCGIEEKEYPFKTDICVSMLMEIDDASIIFEENEE